MALNKFTRRSIMATVGVNAGDIAYVQRLMKSDEGRKHLSESAPAFKRAAVTTAQVTAIRMVMRTSPSLLTAAWRLNAEVRHRFPNIAPMTLHVVKRVMRVFCRAKYKKASTRPKKTLEAERIRERVQFARVFLALHRLDLSFWYVDEYNVDQQPAKQYAWVEPQNTKHLAFKKMNCTAGNVAAVSSAGLLHH